MNEKTHYRKVFKSDHLGIADLEDFLEAKSTLIFTIDHVNQEIGAKVAGKKIDANIAYFVEPIKPLVLNATNSKTMKHLTGSAFVEDWRNVRVQLYIDPTAKLKGEIVGGVRISSEPPRSRRKLERGTEAWDRAIAAYQRDGSLEAVRKHVDVSSEDEQEIIRICSDSTM